MNLRKYQQDAVNAILDSDPQKHVLVSLPTGSGKSHVIGELCKKLSGRILVVTHTRELVLQDTDKVRLHTGEQVGIYCAGLGAKDATSRITVASVQSIVRAHVEPFNTIIVDESHRIPHAKAGQYHALFRKSPQAQIIGLTATPYRLDGGYLHKGDGALFDSLVYDCKTGDLIEQGYLSPIVGYRGRIEADLDGVHTRQGDFVAGEQAERFELIARDTCEDIIRKAEGRKSIMVFCVTVRHATLIAHTLREMGQGVVLVTGESIDRDESIERFKRGLARFLVNIDVLTTGFNFESVDCIAILRATKSAGLYCQIVGRGLRIADGKESCLLLDYGGNIRRHGVLDDVAPDSGGYRSNMAMSKECPSCGAEVSRMAKSCKHCGHVFVSDTQREVKHYAQADDADPLRKQATVYNVSRVLYCRHRKDGKPDSLKVTYCTEGMQYANEWVCVEHSGYPQQKARQWFARRGMMMPETVTDALDTSASLLCPKRITTMRDGKFERVVAYEF